VTETSNCFPTPATTVQIKEENEMKATFEHAVLPTLIEIKDAVAAGPKFDPSTVMVAEPPLVGFRDGNRTLETVGELYTNLR
jgi:hypothetical protein